MPNSRLRKLTKRAALLAFFSAYAVFVVAFYIWVAFGDYLTGSYRELAGLHARIDIGMTREEVKETIQLHSTSLAARDYGATVHVFPKHLAFAASDRELLVYFGDPDVVVYVKIREIYTDSQPKVRQWPEPDDKVSDDLSETVRQELRHGRLVESL